MATEAPQVGSGGRAGGPAASCSQNGTFPDQRYLGTARNNAWLKNRTAALNLRNLIRRGLDRRNGAWTLA